MLLACDLKLFFAEPELICLEYFLDIFVFLDELLVLASALSRGTSANEPGHLFEDFVGSK